MPPDTPFLGRFLERFPNQPLPKRGGLDPQPPRHSAQGPYFTACPLALSAYHLPPNWLAPTYEVEVGAAS
jgi:hypothetical protein